MTRRPEQAKATVLIAVGGVFAFALIVLGVTGVLFGKGAKARREPVADTEPGEGRRWFRFEVGLVASAIPDALAAPFMVGIGDDQKAFVVNGREELPVVVAEGKGSFSLSFPAFGTRLTGSLDAAERFTGTFETFSANGAPLALPVTGARLSDGLPERRFSTPPPRPEARIEGADFSHVWRLSVGPDRRLAKAVFSISESQEAFATIRFADGDLGALAGRQFGRLMLLSTVDGVAVRAVTLAVDETNEHLRGTIATAGEAPIDFTGERADRVALPEPVVTAGPGVGPAIEVYAALRHRPSAEGLALVQRVAAASGVAARGFLVGAPIPDQDALLGALGVTYPVSAVAGSIGSAVGALSPLTALPTIVVRRPDGAAEAIFVGLPSRTAGGAELATRVEAAARKVKPP